MTVPNGYMQPLFDSLNTSMGKLTLAQTIGVPFWVLALIAAAIIIVILIILEKIRPWREELGQDADGYFPE